MDTNVSKELIIRTDDAGMSHSVNTGLSQLLETGYPVSVSVMFACPWYREAVDILKRYDHADAGVHLTLNSEWEHYRWGPVVGRKAVPTLVDEAGHFFHSSAELYENNPDSDEIEMELRAQIERALDSGLSISYLDYHMETVINNPLFREVSEKLAAEYELGLWDYFEMKRWDPHYRAEPAAKTDTLVSMLESVDEGINYLITHVGIDDAELGALRDMNTDAPLANMSKHRQAELDALTSQAFARALEENGIRLITFRDLIHRKGLQNMQRP